jgi:hypothetical protein
MKMLKIRSNKGKFCKNLVIRIEMNLTAGIIYCRKNCTYLLQRISTPTRIKINEL